MRRGSGQRYLPRRLIPAGWDDGSGSLSLGALEQRWVGPDPLGQRGARGATAGFSQVSQGTSGGLSSVCRGRPSGLGTEPPPKHHVGEPVGTRWERSPGGGLCVLGKYPTVFN